MLYLSSNQVPAPWAAGNTSLAMAMIAVVALGSWTALTAAQSLKHPPSKVPARCGATRMTRSSGVNYVTLQPMKKGQTKKHDASAKHAARLRKRTDVLAAKMRREKAKADAKAARDRQRAETRALREKKKADLRLARALAKEDALVKRNEKKTKARAALEKKKAEAKYARGVEKEDARLKQQEKKRKRKRS